MKEVEDVFYTNNEEEIEHGLHDYLAKLVRPFPNTRARAPTQPPNETTRLPIVHSKSTWWLLSMKYKTMKYI